MKVNPRATYFAEAWGNTYDFSQYVSVVPRATRVTLESVADLATIAPVDPAGGAFGEQLDALDRIRRGLDGDAPIIQTVFSPLSVIGWLAGGPAGFEIPGLPASLPLLRQAIDEAPDAAGGRARRRHLDAGRATSGSPARPAPTASSSRSCGWPAKGT